MIFASQGTVHHRYKICYQCERYRRQIMGTISVCWHLSPESELEGKNLSMLILLPRGVGKNLQIRKVLWGKLFMKKPEVENLVALSLHGNSGSIHISLSICFRLQCPSAPWRVVWTISATSTFSSPTPPRNATLIPLLVSRIVLGIRHVFGPPGSVSQRYGSGSGSFPFLIKMLSGMK